MRKTFFLLAILVVLGLALAVALRMSPKGDPTVPTATAVEPSGPESSRLDPSASGAELDARATAAERRAATSLAVDANAATPVASGETTERPSAFSGVLHVRIAPTMGLSEVPANLEVQVASRIGVVYDLWRENDTDFVVRDLRPGSYVVVARGFGCQRAWKRVEVLAGPEGTFTDLPLQPTRLLRVRWRTPAGEPILRGLEAPTTVAAPSKPFLKALPKGAERWTDEASTEGWGRPGDEWVTPEVNLRTRLSVVATRRPSNASGSPTEQFTIASWSKDVTVRHSSEGTRTAAETDAYVAGWRRPVDPGLSQAPDTFCLLERNDAGSVTVAVWRDDVRLAAAEVGPAQDEVVFTTTIEALNAASATTLVNLLFVDADSGAPVPGAVVTIDERGWARADESGRASFPVKAANAPASVYAEGYERRIVDSLRGPASSSDTVVVKLIPEGRESKAAAGLLHVSYRVSGPPGWRAEGYQFELVDTASYDDTRPFDITDANDRRSMSQRVSIFGKLLDGTQDVVSFAVETPRRFALMCTIPLVDMPTILVSPELFSPDEGRIVGEIVIGASRVVGIRFREPPSANTRIVIETADGLPVRTLEANDFGVVQTRLGARAYRLHLIERGRRTAPIAFTVDTDPFFLEVGE